MVSKYFFIFLLNIFLFSNYLFANDEVLKNQEVVLKPGTSITLRPHTTTTVSCLNEPLTHLPKCNLMYTHGTYYRVYSGNVWLSEYLGLEAALQLIKTLQVSNLCE